MTLTAWKKSYDQPRQHIKKQRYYFTDKGPYSQSYGFSSSHVWMWELDHKEIWAPKNWRLWTVVLEKTLESPLDLKEVKPVHPKGNQSWIYIGKTDAEAEIPILWPSEAKNWLIGKDCCWEILRAGGKGDDRGWDGCMTSLTQWTWVCVNSRSWWWTGRPDMLQSMEWVTNSQTQLNWTELSVGTEQINAAADMEKQESLYTVGENINWYSHMKKSMEILQKIKIEPPYDPAILLVGICPKEMKSLYQIYTPLSLKYYLQ